MNKPRGYFAIGILDPKTETNVGTLWRSAYLLGASYIFTIGGRYKRQSSDTVKAYRHIPYHRYSDTDDFRAHIPYDCQLVGIEQTKESDQLYEFNHPERTIYLLGAEDYGLRKQELILCQHVVEIKSTQCLNVSVAGSIVMYDRRLKQFQNLQNRGVES